MSRGSSGPFLAALALPSARVFPLVELRFASGTQYLCGLDFAVTWGGNTYAAALGAMAIDAVTETAGTYPALKLTLQGATQAAVAWALTEKVQGRQLILRLAALDASNAMQVDANVWTGYMDTLSLPADMSTIIVTAEDRRATWDRPRVKRYTDAQQQAEFPGDLGLQYVAELENKQLVWPSAAFFKQ